MVPPARPGASTVIGSDELDALSLGLAVVDARWEIVRWTRALAELTGIPTHDALGTLLWDRLPALRAPAPESALRAAMRDRIPYHGPLRLSDRAGGPVLRSVAPLGDDAILLELDRATRALDETAAFDAVLAAQGEESDLLATVAQSIAHSSIPIETTLGALAERACALLRCGGCSVALVEDATFRTVAAIGSLATTLGEQSPIRSTLGELALLQQQVIIGPRCALVAPMIVEGVALGRLVAEHPARGEFLPSDAVLLQRLSDHAALAVRARQHRAAAERSARDARALTEVIQRINQSLELERVVALVAQSATELVGGVGARVLVIEDDALRASGTYGIEDPALCLEVPVDGSFAGACLSARKPLRVSDLGAPDSPWPWTAQRVQPGRFTAIAIPLLVADRAIGVIVIVGNRARCFDDRDEELLLVLAGHAAIAIENARLFRAAARTMHHASILASNAQALARHVTANAMFADIVRIAREALHADGVGIYLTESGSDRIEVALQDGAGQDAAGAVQQSFWETPLGEAMRSGRPVFIPDMAALRAVRAVDVLLEKGIHAGAILPLMIEGRARGVLTLRYCRVRTFEPQQRQLLTDFGTHVALAVRNAQLFEDLERRAARFEAVAQVQRAISEAVSLDEVYAKIYSAVASVVDSPCFVLLSFDEDTDVFVPEYCINDGDPIETDTLPRFPPGSGNTTQAFLTRQPNVAARSRAGWSGQVHVTEGHGEVAVVLSAPILHGDRALGVLQAQSYDPEAYDWDDVDLVMLIARQAGTAIVNARAFETERRELERAQFAAAVARAALAAGDLAAGADAVLSVVAGACPTSGMTIDIIASGGARRTVATRGTPPATDDASTIRVPLSSGDRTRGELLVRDTSLPMHVRETLCRLADPLALALETLQLREEERHQQERRRVLATALEAMEQPVFIVSRDLIVRYANGAAAAQFGYSPEELVGLHVGTFQVHLWSMQDRNAAARAMDEVGHWAGERPLRRKDGNDFPAWLIVSPIRDGTRRRVGHVIVVRDLTEERRMAEQLRQSEKLAALGELVAGVAHEVNNPLTGISAFAQLLLEDDLSGEQRESVSLMKREADRAVAVIRDLLAFARKTGPRSVMVDMNDLVEQTLRLRAYGMRSTGVALETSLDPALAPVRGDDRQLQQVLLNLIVNAEHAMASTPVRQLAVTTRNEGSRVVVEVRDTGTGMTPEVQKRIFEPFFTTKPEGTGTGLGLSVSYGIMQSHAGTLSAQSVLGTGSTFRISLPASTAADGAAMAANIGRHS
ncbi:MAG TPA: GAF domain-containing protein [Gemmatimonadaceae bacterium]|nr:GAF domain-containing protein [Gemmatimonadaceae bacterium]